MNERNDTAVEAVLEHLIEHGPGDIAIQPEPRPEPEKEAAAAIFAFCNHSRTRLKLLLHDGSGLWLCSKRLDAGCFTWPADGPADPMTAAQLWALIAGLEVSGWKKHWRR